MRVWRLCGRQYAAPDGEGARLFGGRWNSPGVAVVYTSATLSLAVLEYLVNLDSDLFPENLIALSADIPSDLEIQSVTTADLPANWREYPGPDTLCVIGAAWAAVCHTTIFSVPSVVIPEERNYLLNPAHPLFSRISWNAPKPFRFDSRLRPQRSQ